MKLSCFISIGFAGLAATVMSAAVGDLPKTGLAGSTHDVGGNGCKSCHAPHNGAMATGGPQSAGLICCGRGRFPPLPTLSEFTIPPR